MEHARQAEGGGRVTVVARRAAVRRGVRDVLVASGRWSGIGALIGAAGVVCERVFGLFELAGLGWAVGGMNVWVGVAIACVPAAVLGVAGGYIAWSRRVSLIDAAIGVDRAMGLQDRFSSAVSFGELGGDEGGDAFVVAAIAEGERAAESADVRRAVPMRMGRGWWVAAGGVAAGVSAAVWMPAVGLLSSDSRRAREASFERVSHEREKADEAERAIAALRESLASQDAGGRGDDAERAGAATVEQMAALERIEEELRSGNLSAAEARREAAGVLDRAARETERQSEVEKLEADALRERLAESARRASGASGGDDGEAGGEDSALREALRRGAFGEAAEAAERLADRAETLDAAERERLARTLREYADAMRESGTSPEDFDGVDDGFDGSADDADGVLSEAGLDAESAERVMGESDAGERRRLLEEAGLSEDEAARVAERLAEAERASEAKRRAEESAERLRDAFEESADRLGDAGDETEDRRDSEGESEDRGDGETGGEEGGEAGRDGVGDGEEGRERSPGGEAAGGVEDERSPGGREEGPAGEQGQDVRDRGAQGERRPEGAGAVPSETGAAGEESAAEQRRSREEEGESGGASPPTGGEAAGEEGQKPGGEGAGERGEDGSGGAKGGQREGGPEGAGGREVPEELGDEGVAQDGVPGGDGEAGEMEGGATGAGSEAGGGAEGDEQGFSDGPAVDDAGEPQDRREGLRRLADELRRLDERSRDTADRERDAREMAERARELLEGASEEELEELRAWAERMREEGFDPSGEGGRDGAPPMGDDVTPPLLPEGAGGVGDGPGDGREGAGDGRRLADESGRRERLAGVGDDEDGVRDEPGGARRQRVVAEWLGDGEDRADGAGGSGLAPGSADRVLREARESAERAIEERVVPSRYDRFVREYYRRLPERVSPRGDGAGGGEGGHAGGGGD